MFVVSASCMCWSRVCVTQQFVCTQLSLPPKAQEVNPQLLHLIINSCDSLQGRATQTKQRQEVLWSARAVKAESVLYFLYVCSHHNICYRCQHHCATANLYKQKEDPKLTVASPHPAVMCLNYCCWLSGPAPAITPAPAAPPAAAGGDGDDGMRVSWSMMSSSVTQLRSDWYCTQRYHLWGSVKQCRLAAQYKSSTEKRTNHIPAASRRSGAYTQHSLDSNTARPPLVNTGPTVAAKGNSLQVVHTPEGQFVEPKLVLSGSRQLQLLVLLLQHLLTHCSHVTHCAGVRSHEK